MQKKRNLIILMIAVLCGFIGVYFVMKYAVGNKPVINEAYSDKPMMKVVVAAQDIPENVRITGAMIEVSSVPSEYILRGAYEALDDVLGSMTKTAIYKGEQIMGGRISRGDTPDEFSYRIPEGKRAVSLAINNINGVAGFIQPRDRIDVLLTMRLKEISSHDSSQQNQDQTIKAWEERLKLFKRTALKLMEGRRIISFDGDNITFTLFQDVEVLAMGKKLIRGKDNKDGEDGLSTITLCLDEHQVELITNAETVGSIKFSLKNPGDSQIIELKPIVE